MKGRSWREKKIINLRIVKGKERSTGLKQKSVKQMQVEMKKDNGD